MSASILNFLRQKVKQPAPWANEELAELYRVVDILSRAGIKVETETGLSDEGDPWFVFCRTDTGEVIAHFARIDGQFIAASVVSDQIFQGRNFREIIDSLATRQPLLIPRPSGDNKLFLHPSVVITAFIATALMYSKDNEWNGSEASDHPHKEAAAGSHDSSAAAGKEGGGAHNLWGLRHHSEVTNGKNPLFQGTVSPVLEQRVTQASIIAIAISVLDEVTSQHNTAVLTNPDEGKAHATVNAQVAVPTPETQANPPMFGASSQPNADTVGDANAKLAQERVAPVQEKLDVPPPHQATLAFANTLQQATEFVPTSDGKSDKIELPNVLDCGKYHLVFLSVPASEDNIVLPTLGLLTSSANKVIAAGSSYNSTMQSNYVVATASSYSGVSPDSNSHKDTASIDSQSRSTPIDDAQKGASVLSSVAQNTIKTGDHGLFEVFVSDLQGGPAWTTLDIGLVFASTPNSSAGVTATSQTVTLSNSSLGSGSTLTKVAAATASTSTPTATSNAESTTKTTATVTPSGTSQTTDTGSVVTPGTASVAAAAVETPPTASPFDTITEFMNNSNDVITMALTPSNNLKTSLKMYQGMSSGPIKIILFDSASIHIDIFQFTPGVLFVEQSQVSWNVAAGVGSAPGTHSVDLNLANGGDMKLLGVLPDSAFLAAV